MSTVWMAHPDLPPEQIIEVDEVSVPHHGASGWVVTDPPPPAPRPESEDPQAPAEAVASAPESVSESEPAQKAPTARRAPKEAEQK
jgi:hypothetical protein